jgi:iduronate 2-sulfatase
MRLTPLFLVFGLLGACSQPDSAPAKAANQDRPNILFLAVDDLRPELGCYGAPDVLSPALDGLAASGFVFESAYCQAGVCNPSRASLMTGMRPETIGVLDLWTDLRMVRPDALSMPQHFRLHGYYAASIGKIYHNVFPDEPSWDERVYLPGFPFDPDAVYAGERGLAQQQAKIAVRAEAGRPFQEDRLGHIYVKAQATEAPDVPDNAYYDGAQTDWAVSKLRELADSDQPWFLAVGYYRPHLPFNAPKKYWDLYDRAAITLAPDPAIPIGAPSMAMNNLRELRGYTDFLDLGHPSDSRLSEEDQRRLKHGYLASVSYVDAQIGRLLNALDELDLSADTIVVVWGDHGWKLGEKHSWGKMTNFEIDTRVPLIVRVPGAHAKGTRTPALVEFVDIFPSLCELAGLPSPPDLEGLSFAPLLDEPNRAWKTAAFSQFLRESIWVGPSGDSFHGRAIRTDSMRYVEWHAVEGGALAGVELYDYSSGVGEARNLADDPAYAQARTELAAALQAGWRGALPKQSP